MSGHIHVKVIRSKRKTMALQIDRSGQVIVRVPYHVDDDEVRKFLNSKKSWIVGHLNNLDRHLPDEKEKKLTEAEIRLLKVRAKRIIPQRAAHFAPIIGTTYGNITIRCQRSRWGSCSSRGNLNFNCLLMLAPPEVLDYVVVHELCHRHHMNHSHEFWEEVRGIIPEYKKYERWLKENGRSLIRRLPES